MAVTYLKHGFTTNRAKVCVTYPFTLRELEEMETDLSEPPSQIMHKQETVKDVCIEYKPSQTGRGATRRDTADPGAAQQGKATTNLKEVGEKTGDYFKRVNVFEVQPLPRRSAARHDVAALDSAGQGAARQDKELKNEDL